MSGLESRVSLATFDVLDSGEVVLRPTDDEVRAWLAGFKRRAGERGSAQAVWTREDVEGRPVLVVRLVATTGEAIEVALSPPAELWQAVRPGPLTVAIVLGEELADPDESEVALVEGFLIPTPGLR